jgi:hypothetical protein
MEQTTKKLDLGWLWKHIPFTKTRKVWKKQLEEEEKRLDTAGFDDLKIGVYDNHIKQNKIVDSVSFTFFSILTTLWTLLPHFIDFDSVLGGKLSFVNLGMNGGGFSWAEDAMLFIVPTIGGTVIHKAPHIVPNKKARLIVSCTVKCVPFILSSYWIIKIAMENKKLKAKSKELFKKQTQLEK